MREPRLRPVGLIAFDGPPKSCSHAVNRFMGSDGHLADSGRQVRHLSGQ
ncbi:MAG: hypothetical protein M3548_00355 [Actinomycetota bacterium]|nr:hypothetical protein [Actinomycetota bacterium]